MGFFDDAASEADDVKELMERIRELPFEFFEDALEEKAEPMTEEEWAAMTDEERDAYLRNRVLALFLAANNALENFDGALDQATKFLVDSALKKVVQWTSYGIHDDDMDLHTSVFKGEKTGSEW